MPESGGSREANSSRHPCRRFAIAVCGWQQFETAGCTLHTDGDCKSPARLQATKSHLDKEALQCKVIAMQPNWAEENLQVIRTLMERAGLYRWALAPVMLTVGLLGLGGAFAGEVLGFDSAPSFIRLWFLVAFAAIAFSLLIVRRQALRSEERFWTPPTKKVCMAMTPALTAGFLIAAVPMLDSGGSASAVGYVFAWPLLYGCALHSAGQFISRGVRLLGWAFVFSAVFLGYLAISSNSHTGLRDNAIVWLRPHRLMGCMFGGLHLLAAAYLYFTEKKEPTP